VKRNILLAVAVVLAVVATAFLMAGCETKHPEESWTYVGTWTNPAYNSHGGMPPGKIVVTVNSMTLYANDIDTTNPVGTGSLTVTADWTSGGARYFKISTATSFSLGRVSNNNNTLEVNDSATAYPASIDPSDPSYRIWTRQ
jgi:hypothetical protein